jgi:hypothetical protein
MANKPAEGVLAGDDSMLDTLLQTLEILKSELKAEINAVKSEVTSVQVKITRLEKSFDSMQEDFGRLDRTVSAIESAPVPYGRPKTLHRATEYQSVSRPITKRLGYSGN